MSFILSPLSKLKMNVGQQKTKRSVFMFNTYKDQPCACFVIPLSFFNVVFLKNCQTPKNEGYR